MLRQPLKVYSQCSDRVSASQRQCSEQYGYKHALEQKHDNISARTVYRI